MPRRLACLPLLLALVTASCGGDDAPPVAGATPTVTPQPTASPQPTATPRPPKDVRRAHCPPDAGNCAEATGRVIYVEAVDPDGDGDAHYVLAGGRITAPGLSVIDVAKDLRPPRLPRPGDLVSAAGPVYQGSHGQSQIEAVEVHYRRR
jgi:hypothetical protein